MSELGSRLRLAREEKSLTLDELQEITRIQKRYLSAIEEGKYDIMPGKFYVRAFIKQYAEAVDLEPEWIFEEYKNEIPPAHDHALPEELSRVQSRKAISPRLASFLDILPKIISAILILALLFGIWYFVTYHWNADKNSDPPNNAPVDITESNEIQPTDDEATKDAVEQADKDSENSDQENAAEQSNPEQEITVTNVSGQTTLYSLSNTDQFELTVKITQGGRSWIEVKENVSNKSFLGKEMKDGESETFDFTDESEIYVRTGRAFETEIYINGEKLEYELDAQKNVVQNIIIKFNKSE